MCTVYTGCFSPWWKRVGFSIATWVCGWFFLEFSQKRQFATGLPIYGLKVPILGAFEVSKDPKNCGLAVLLKDAFQDLVSITWFIFLDLIYTWNPNDLYFWRSTPQNKVFSNQNNEGHLGSR